MYKFNIEQKHAVRAQNEVKGNSGNVRECALSLQLTGQMRYGDNVRAEVKGDILDIQVKSSHSSLGKGQDMMAIVSRDAANRYAYVTKDFAVYMMTSAEYLDFANRFAFVDYDSKQNGGAYKMRLLPESKKMLRWLDERVG